MSEDLSEKDVFDFIFFPRIIAKKKKALLQKIEYKCIGKFYCELKFSLSSIKITPEIKSRLKKAIPIYRYK